MYKKVDPFYVDFLFEALEKRIFIGQVSHNYIKINILRRTHTETLFARIFVNQTWYYLLQKNNRWVIKKDCLDNVGISVDIYIDWKPLDLKRIKILKNIKNHNKVMNPFYIGSLKDGLLLCNTSS